MSGYNKRSRVEAAIWRYKQAIGDGLRFRKDGRRTTEKAVDVWVLNQTLKFGRPLSVRNTRIQMGSGRATLSSMHATLPILPIHATSPQCSLVPAAGICWGEYPG